MGYEVLANDLGTGIDVGGPVVQGLEELGRRQAELRANIEALEKAVGETRQQLAEAFLKRCQELRDEKRRQVDEFLSGEEGREWFEARKARLLAETADKGGRGGCMSAAGEKADPQAAAGVEEQIFNELMHDPQERVEQKASQELEPRFREVAWRFRAKGSAVLDALEALETRAGPYLEALSGLPNGPVALRASGFLPGIAAQVARRLPVLRGSNGEGVGDDGSWDAVAGAKAGSAAV